jgi:hypothetical protein
MAQSADDQELMELSRSAHVSGYAAGVPSGPGASNPDVIDTWQKRKAAQREAYGQFVALDMIHIAGVPVFAPGQQVPLEHIIRFNLLEQELVARVATPEQARAGKTFESDSEFAKANPHVARRAPAIPEAHPAALDPRGAGAEHDPEGKHLSKPAAEVVDVQTASAPKSTAKSAASGKDA